MKTHNEQKCTHSLFPLFKSLKETLMYADDLGLTTNDPGEMQKMLDRLRVYAQRKGLTVNSAKSEVVHFNSNSVCLSSAEPFYV